MMSNKKGSLGGFISMFVATILIIIILIIYLLLGALITTFDASAGQIRVEKEQAVGLGPLLTYEGQIKIIKLQSLLSNQQTLDDAIREVYYDPK